MAVNWTDGKLFTRDANNQLVSITLGGSGSIPTASASVLGGVKVGSGLTITDGVLAATGGGGSGLTWSSVPASATATGTAGQIAYDGSYFYVAVGSNQWERAALSTWPTDPYFSSVTLLMHMDGTGSTFTDSSGTPKTITANGNATQSTAQSKFGGVSALFDGSGDYLSGATSDATRFPGDFTVEFWAFVLVHKSFNVWFDCRSAVSSTAGFAIASNSSGEMALFTNNGFAITGSSAFTASQWTHFALVRSGSTITLYQGGQSVGTTTNSTHFSDGTLAVGISFADINHSVNGYIDELRITKGVARYTANFTPPTAAFPDA
jgi:hypothetical protein